LNRLRKIIVSPAGQIWILTAVDQQEQTGRYRLSSMDDNDVLVEAQDLRVYFPVTQGIIWQKRLGYIKAVDGATFCVKRGETLGLVGESGCGKSTIGRTLVRLNQPTSGRIVFRGQDLVSLKGQALRRQRRALQMIFQDPYASLNPRMNVENIISEPLEVHKVLPDKRQRQERVRELMRVVGLNPGFIKRYPHEFSGGQRQRIGIARSLAANPEFVVCDEPVSSLDVSIQAQILNLLRDLQNEFGLTYLFIAHDLSVVRHISNRIAVMYLGRLVELANRDELYLNPLHPYSQALLSAVPIPDPRVERRRKRVILQGEIPGPMNTPAGCAFSTRCPEAVEVCHEAAPEFRDRGDGHWVACHLYS
jgi:oligopeptide transport system ATP-binding protein